jgi:hypothetical protein
LSKATHHNDISCYKATDNLSFAELNKEPVLCVNRAKNAQCGFTSVQERGPAHTPRVAAVEWYLCGTDRVYISGDNATLEQQLDLSSGLRSGCESSLLL